MMHEKKIPSSKASKSNVKKWCVLQRSNLVVSSDISFTHQRDLTQ